MLIFDETGRSWALGKEIASGGEGTVRRLLDSTEYCAKLYHKVPLSKSKQDKLKALRSLPASARRNAAIPVSLGFAAPGDPVAHSVILPLVTGHDIYELYNPQGRHAHFQGATFEFLVAAAKNVAAAFHNLHQHGIVVGDVNEQNIKVRTDATVSIIDCDSFQFGHEGTLYTSDVGTPIWTPPELQGSSVYGLARSTNHDAFGLAQLIFLLLFAGRYPYAGKPVTNTQMSPEEAIQRYAFAYSPAPKSQLLAPPPGSPPFESVPPRVRNLFVKAFEEGSGIPGQRPSAGEWIEVLEELADSLTFCPGSQQHVYWRGATACPWCSVMRSVRSDLFPGLAGRVEETPVAAQENFILARRLMEMAFHPMELVEPSTFAIEAFIAARTPIKPQRSLLIATLSFLGMGEAKRKAVDTLNLELRELDHLLLYCAKRRKSSVQHYQAKCASLLQNAAVLAGKLKDVNAIQASALEQLQMKHFEAAREKYLEGFLVRRIKIPGIGDTRIAALLSAGITTAADVREETIMSVLWFGASYATKLMEWRRHCESQFKFNASASLPDSLRGRMNGIVRASIAALVEMGKSLESEFNSVVEAYSNDFSKLQRKFEDAYKRRAAVERELARLK
jgi:DNA-binding helix-hairpin-helix protein with protein kinase domain